MPIQVMNLQHELKAVILAAGKKSDTMDVKSIANINIFARKNNSAQAIPSSS